METTPGALDAGAYDTRHRREFPVRRLFLIALSGAIILSACGSSKSWPGGGTSAPSGHPASAAVTLAPTEAAPTEAAPTEAAPTEAAPTEAPTTAGIVFSPSGGGFTAVMPGKPALTTQTFSTAVGDAPASMWTYEVSSDLAYIIVQAKYPKGSMTGHGSSGVFDAALNGMVTSTTGATIAAKADTTLNGHPGRSFTIDTPAMSIKGALYIINDDLYMVYVGYTSTITDMTDVDGFLASFQFTI